MQHTPNKRATFELVVARIPAQDSFRAKISGFSLAPTTASGLVRVDNPSWALRQPFLLIFTPFLKEGMATVCLSVCSLLPSHRGLLSRKLHGESPPRWWCFWCSQSLVFPGLSVIYKLIHHSSHNPGSCWGRNGLVVAWQLYCLFVSWFRLSQMILLKLCLAVAQCELFWVYIDDTTLKPLGRANIGLLVFNGYLRRKNIIQPVSVPGHRLSPSACFCG